MCYHATTKRVINRVATTYRSAGEYKAKYMGKEQNQLCTSFLY